MQGKNKKGEAMTVSTVIGIIIVVLGLVLLLFILYQFAWNRNVDSEACHQSVILRGSLPSLAGGSIPLKCKSEKVCITSKLFGGNCSAEYGDLKGITKVRVTSTQQIEKTYSEKAAECWSVMGEGKLSIFDEVRSKEFGLGKIYSSCVICSRIAFDRQSLSENQISFENFDLMKYMQTHAVPGKDVSYFDYFGGMVSVEPKINGGISVPGVKEIKDNSGSIVGFSEDTSAPREEIDLLSQDEVNQEIQKQRSDFSLQTRESAILFMQISAPKQGESFMNIVKAGLGISAGSFVIAPSRTISVARAGVRLCAGSGPAAVACGGIAALLGVVQQGNVAYNRAIAAGYCGDLSVGDNARDGCSVVRILDYNEADIKQYCGVIESIP